jgi:hypothetical protein
VHAEDFLINESADRQAVETICECFPKSDVISTFAFVVESVNAVDRSAFVISTKKEEILGVLDFVCKKQTNRFQALFSTIYIVS